MGKLLLCATVLTGTAAASRCRGSWRRSLRVQQAATLLHSTKFKRADAVTLATQAIALAMIYPEPRSSPRGTLKNSTFDRTMLSHARMILHHSSDLAQDVLASRCPARRSRGCRTTAAQRSANRRAQAPAATGPSPSRAGGFVAGPIWPNNGLYCARSGAVQGGVAGGIGRRSSAICWQTRAVRSARASPVRCQCRSHWLHAA